MQIFQFGALQRAGPVNVSARLVGRRCGRDGGGPRVLNYRSEGAGIGAAGLVMSIDVRSQGGRDLGWQARTEEEKAWLSVRL